MSRLKTKNSKKAEPETFDFSQVEFFVLGNWKKIMIGAAAVLVCIIAAFVSVSVYDSAEAKAAAALTSADGEAALTAALDKYGDCGGAALSARLRLARIYINKGDFAKASGQFALIVAGNPPENILNRMKLDEAYLWECAGDRSKAAARLEAMSLDSSLSAGLRAEAGCGAGRLYLALGDKDKARAALSGAVKLRNAAGMGNTQWCAMAQFLLVSSGL